MKLCIDVGNTTSKLGVYNGNTLIKKMTFTTDVNKTVDELLDLLTAQLNLKNIDIGQINEICYSSVVPTLNYAYKSALGEIFDASILVIEPGVKTGLMVKVDNPSEIGADLIAGLVGTKEKYGYPALLVDLGTATKILLLDNKGVFTSCVIMPGMMLSLKSLSSNAALLPEVTLDNPKKLLNCKNTVEAMVGGIVYGHAHMIDGIVRQYERELGYPVKKILTGGASELIKTYISSDFIHDNNVTLDGLNKILERNRGTK